MQVKILFLLAYLSVAHCCKSVQSNQRKYNVILLGAKGSGKSSLGLGLLGYQGYKVHPSSTGNGCFEPADTPGKHSYTTEPCQITGHLFYYDSHVPEITVIDTPGFETDGASNMRNFEKTTNYLSKEIKKGTIFVVMLKYTLMEWDLVNASLKMYELFYGPEFFNHVVFCYNFMPHYGQNFRYIKDMWSRHVNNEVKHSRKILSVFVNPLQTTPYLRGQIEPMLKMLYNMSSLTLNNPQDLIAEVADLKSKQVKLIESLSPKKLTSQEVTNLEKPITCGKAGQPIVIGGKTLYHDTKIYGFMDMVYAGLVGVGGSFLVIGVFILMCNVCSKEKKDTQEKFKQGPCLVSVSEVKKSPKVWFKFNYGKYGKAGKESKDIVTHLEQEKKNEDDETVLDLPLPVLLELQPKHLIATENVKSPSIFEASESAFY